MANATTRDSTATNPGGTGTTITTTLPTHAAGDVIKIAIGNTGNTLWTGNPAGWTRVQQLQVGTSANGILITVFQRRVLAGDSIPFANPTFTLGATVTRIAFAWAEDGASEEGVFSLSAWAARAMNTGTSNPIRPSTITTPAPEGLITTVYFQRAATNAPDPSGYTQDEEIVISGTLVGNLAHKTVADQATVLSNQDASPTSGVRWGAAIFCTPSADYPYYRSASQATANGTNVTPALPAGTTATDVNSNKDFMIITVEGAGSTTLSMQDGAWTEIATWDTTTSGGGSTVSKFWAYMTGTPPGRQANRTGSGEISAQICTFYNCKQTSPIGSVNARQNASSTTSTWNALTRNSTKAIVQSTCVADGVPTFTSPTGWNERTDGLGISTADQIYDPTGSSASAAFTLSSASPTLVGLVEIIGLSSSTNVSVNLTGSSSTSASGSLGSERSTSMTGLSTSATAGSVSPASTVNASGLESPLSAGNLSVTSNLALQGQISTIEQGSLAPSLTVSISGESITGAVGTVTYEEDQGVTVALTGIVASFAQGAPAAESSIGLVGEASTVNSGSLGPEFALNVSGNAVNSESGLLGVAQDLSISGVSTEASTGSVVVTSSITISGFESIAEQGLLDFTKSGSAVLPGQSAEFQTGSLSASLSVDLSGESAASALETFGTQTQITVLGLAGTAEAGSLLSERELDLSGSVITGVAGQLSTGEGLRRARVNNRTKSASITANDPSVGVKPGITSISVKGRR